MISKAPARRKRTIRSSRVNQGVPKGRLFLSVKNRLFLPEALLLLLFLLPSLCSADQILDNLWMGLIAEDTSGDLQTYRIIASVVQNRAVNGLNSGLVALRRKGLDSFVKRNRAYILAKKGIDLKALAIQAINDSQTQDYAFGATHYEHTQIFPVPAWAKDMKVVKTVYPNTKQEITLWKDK